MKSIVALTGTALLLCLVAPLLTAPLTLTMAESRSLAFALLPLSALWMMRRTLAR